MKKLVEPKSLFIFLSVVFVSIVIIVGSLGYYVGTREDFNLTNVEDSSAAVEYSNDGDIYANFPDKIAVGEVYPISLSYYGEYPQNDLPDWTVTICGKTRTKKNAQNLNINHKFAKAGNCPVKITVKATTNSTLNTTLKVYNIKNTHKNVNFYEDGNSYVVNKNNFSGISHIGVVNKNYVSTQWNWKASGVCRLVGNTFDLRTDSVATFASGQPGLCKLTYKTFVFYENFAVKVTGNKTYTITSSSTSNSGADVDELLSYDTNLIEDDFAETNDSPPEPDGDICGPIDEDGNGMINIYDFALFSLKYGKGGNSCLDGNVNYGVCGGKDVDTNGKLELYDFYSFVKRYGLKSCTLGDNSQPKNTPTPTLMVSEPIMKTPTPTPMTTVTPTPVVITRPPTPQP